jgi:hypothetical protein
MLCTRCSRGIRPVVAVDIDGTLGDYHNHLAAFAVDYLDRDYADAYDGSMQYRDWFCEQFECDPTTFREIKLAYRAGGQKRTMPLFLGADHFMKALTTLGVEVWLTTTRPYLKLDGIDRDTREWLRRNEILYNYLMYDENKYDILAEQVEQGRVVGVLDDEPAQLANAERHWGPRVPILRCGTYNVRATWEGQRAETYGAAIGIIANNVDEWRSQHVGA